MEIKRFDIEKDLKRLENYLRDCYCSTGNMTSWLPERLHDLMYSIKTADCQSQQIIFSYGRITVI